MKKKYIIPILDVTNIELQGHLLIDSMKIDGSKTAIESKGGFVKGNSTSSNYSVWDDDWQ